MDDFLARHPGVKYIVYLTVDYGNVARCLLTTTSRARHIAATHGSVASASSMQFASWAITGTDDDVEQILEGSAHWRPHWETLRLAHRVDQAIVMCSLEEIKAGPAHELDRDPRTVLQRVIDEARREDGIECMVGYEIEFHLLDGPGPSGPNEGAYSMSVVREARFDVVLEMVDAIERAGISTWAIHPEVNKDEYEISLAPRDALGAVDDLIHAQNIIRGIARRHDLVATMHPQRAEQGPTIGNHTHISVNKCGDAFLAGLVEGLEGISAILMGGYDSFGGGRNAMLGDGKIGWSESKSTPIRRFSENHFENRVPDCLANPYLQLAALIGTGMEGVRGVGGGRRRSSLGQDHGTLPMGQASALDLLERNETMRRILGSAFETQPK
ncbi:hypothetical protein BD324DRAFT_654254 [Kockovaella imperatae]|uniref:GS catalytic domain-containing protein n=1 Tax=Kockovaella imperatae TaxID=4999 RepID=A0A1Y1U862_9TREE|nr:hypothetical protein BD324DRAFT_654254 [Kockovaella imperatae]ORX33305.1 hypothetical protein BD324DRAFT_654254 [Kockovaella imperatae]